MQDKIRAIFYRGFRRDPILPTNFNRSCFCTLVRAANVTTYLYISYTKYLRCVEQRHLITLGLNCATKSIHNLNEKFPFY